MNALDCLVRTCIKLTWPNENDIVRAIHWLWIEHICLPTESVNCMFLLIRRGKEMRACDVRHHNFDWQRRHAFKWLFILLYYVFSFCWCIPNKYLSYKSESPQLLWTYLLNIDTFICAWKRLYVICFGRYFH